MGYELDPALTRKNGAFGRDLVERHLERSEGARAPSESKMTPRRQRDRKWFGLGAVSLDQEHARYGLLLQGVAILEDRLEWRLDRQRQRLSAPKQTFRLRGFLWLLG